MYQVDSVSVAENQNWCNMDMQHFVEPWDTLQSKLDKHNPWYVELGRSSHRLTIIVALPQKEQQMFRKASSS